MIAGLGRDEQGLAPGLCVVGGAAHIGFEVAERVFDEVEEEHVAAGRAEEAHRHDIGLALVFLDRRGRAPSASAVSGLHRNDAGWRVILCSAIKLRPCGEKRAIAQHDDVAFGVAWMLDGGLGDEG